MGGLLHFLEFNNGEKSKKMMKRRRHTKGKKGSRDVKDDMKIPSDTSSIHLKIYENIQDKNPPKANQSSISTTPMNKLINEEMPKQVNFSRGTPSVIARLMGVDELPFESKTLEKTKGKSNDILRNEIPQKHQSSNYSELLEKANTVPAKLRKQPPPSSSNTNSNIHSQASKSIRPKPREHPQEELLQNFKKDFEAWQTKKRLEQKKIIGEKRNPKLTREKQKSTQGNLENEKVVKCEDERAMVKAKMRGSSSHVGGPNKNPPRPNSTETSVVVSKELDISEPIKKNGSSFSSTRIVVLKPGDAEDTLPASSAIAVQKELSMEDFLEEVRNKLRMEIHGNSGSRTMRENTSEVNSTERSNGPKQVAQNIARQIRRSVTKDVCTILTQSESTRSYDGEVQYTESDSPEFTNRDTRIHLSPGRLKNALRKKSRSLAGAKMIEEKIVCWDENQNSLTEKTRSFREFNGTSFSPRASPRNIVRSLSAPVSDIAIEKLLLEDQHMLEGSHVRRKQKIHRHSISSRKKSNFDFKESFSNLRHTLKGGLFGRKVHHVEKTSTSELESPKDKQTVTSHVKKTDITQTRQENHSEVPPSPASVSSIFYDDFCKPGHPSPISPLDMSFVEGNQTPQFSKDISCDFPQTSDKIVCNIPQMSNENCSDIPQMSKDIYNDIPQTSKDIKCDIPEISKDIDSDSPQNSELTRYDILNTSEEILLTCEEKCAIDEPNIEKIKMTGEMGADIKVYDDEILYNDNLEEAYVRTILVTAGFYEMESAQDALLRWDLSHTLPKSIFEEVEKAFCGIHYKEDIDAFNSTYEATSLDRKMLFDLVNEVFTFAVKPFISSIGLKRYPILTALPHGNKLFEDVLSQIRNLTYIPEEETDFKLESVASDDIKKSPWSTMMDEDAAGAISEVELSILTDLVEDFVLELYYD